MKGTKCWRGTEGVTGKVSSGHAKGEINGVERTAEEGKRETEPEVMGWGGKRKGEDQSDGRGWRDGCSESAEDRQMKGRAWGKNEIDGQVGTRRGWIKEAKKSREGSLIPESVTLTLTYRRQPIRKREIKLHTEQIHTRQNQSDENGSWGALIEGKTRLRAHLQAVLACHLYMDRWSKPSAFLSLIFYISWFQARLCWEPYGDGFDFHSYFFQTYYHSVTTFNYKRLQSIAR